MEAEETKMRWQEYIEELYKKDLHYPDNNDGVITHLELDILECEVKWASLQTKSTPTSALLTTPKPLTVRITTNGGKF